MDEIFVYEPREEERQEVPVTTQCEKTVKQPREEERQEVPVTTQCEKTVKPAVITRRKKPVPAGPSPLDKKMKGKCKKVRTFYQENKSDLLDQWLSEEKQRRERRSKPLTSGQDVLQTEKTTKIVDVEPLVEKRITTSLEPALYMKDLQIIGNVCPVKLHVVLEALVDVQLTGFDTSDYKMVKTITVEEFFSSWSQLRLISTISLYKELKVMVQALSRCIEDQPAKYLLVNTYTNNEFSKVCKLQDEFKECCSLVMMINIIFTFGKEYRTRHRKQIMDLCCIEENTTKSLLENMKSAFDAGLFFRH